MNCQECGKKIRSISKYGYCVKHRHLAQENKDRKKKWVEENYKERRNENSKKFYYKNENEKKLYAKEYRKSNRKKINENRKKRYHEDKLFNIRIKISNRFHQFIRNEKSVFEYTKYLKEEYLEILKERFIKDYPNFIFEECLLSSDYHIDHIIPISLAKNKKQIIKLSAPINMRLITSQENLIKQNKILGEEIVKYNLENLAVDLEALYA